MFFREGMSYFRMILLVSIFGLFLAVSISIASKVILFNKVTDILELACVPISLFLFRLTYKKINRIFQLNKAGDNTKKRFFSIVSLLMLIPLITYIYTVKGLASFLHSISVKEQAELVFTVDFKQASYRSTGRGGGRCRGGIYIKEARTFLGHKVCTNDYNIWSSLKKGDTIIVSGKLSLFAFDYKDVKKRTKP